MKPFKIFVKDVNSFIFNERITYACGEGKRFIIRVYAAPGVPRYIVQVSKTKEEKAFIKKGDAVKYFNGLDTESHTGPVTLENQETA